MWLRKTKPMTVLCRVEVRALHRPSMRRAEVEPIIGSETDGACAPECPGWVWLLGGNEEELAC